MFWKSLCDLRAKPLFALSEWFDLAFEDSLSAEEMFVYTKYYTSKSFTILLLFSRAPSLKPALKTQILLKSPPLEQRACMHECVCVDSPSQLHLPSQTAVAPAHFFSRDLAHVLINITTASLAILSQSNHASCTTDVFSSLVKWITICPASCLKECGRWGSQSRYCVWQCFMSDDDTVWEISVTNLGCGSHFHRLITFTFPAFCWWFATIFGPMLSVPITACSKYHVFHQP